MKARMVLKGFVLSTVLLASAHGAPISQSVVANPGATALEQVGGGMLFAAPKLPNPWDSSLATVGGVTPTVAASEAEEPLSPQSHYRYETHASAAHGVSPKTDVAHVVNAASRISEPASEVLLLIGLSALAIVIRRKMPE